MFRINKIFTCTFILTIVLSVLSACSSTESNESSIISEESKTSAEVVTDTYSVAESTSLSTTETTVPLQSAVTSTESDMTEETTSTTASQTTTIAKTTTTSQTTTTLQTTTTTTAAKTSATTKNTTISSEIKTDPPKTEPSVTTTKEINTREPVPHGVDFIDYTYRTDHTIFDSNCSNYYIKKAAITNKTKELDVEMSYDRKQVNIHCTFEIEFDVEIEWYNDELNKTCFTSTHVVFYS